MVKAKCYNCNSLVDDKKIEALHNNIFHCLKCKDIRTNNNLKLTQLEKCLLVMILEHELEESQRWGYTNDERVIKRILKGLEEGRKP